MTTDRITTILGLVAGLAALLGTSGVITEPLAGAIGGVAAALLGYFVQRPSPETKSGDSVNSQQLTNILSIFHR